MKEVEITDKLVNAYSQTQNKKELKVLLVSYEKSKELIRQGFDLGTYIFLFINIIFAGNLLMIMKLKCIDTDSPVSK